MKKLVLNSTTVSLSLLFFLIGFTVSAQTRSGKTLPQLGKNSVKEVIAAMTLEEKAKLVVGNGFKMPGLPPQGPVVGQTQDKVAGASGTTFGISRLGIPSIVVSDGPAGVRIDSVRKGESKTYYATAWPVATLLASSWDTALVKKVGEAFGSEVHDYGIDILLAPGLNIHRNPLGGRNFEYYSEDPVVAGNMTAAIVNGIESNGVGTSIKHFAVNNQETNRNTVNAIVGERALREIYLKGFQIAIKKSQPWTVMSSYNKINGTYTSQEYDLLTTILRKEWGFKGFVMSDWFGGKEPIAQMQAGNDLLMPGTAQQTEKIIDAVSHDSLDVKILDKNVERILNIILQSPSFKKYKFSDKPDLAKDAAIAKEAASQGMVLLKNTGNVLPLKNEIKNVALFGINGYELIAGGTGSGDVNKAYSISLMQGLNNAGYIIDADVKNVYTEYLTAEKIKHPKKGFFEEFMHPTPPIVEYDSDSSLVYKKAAETDVAIIAIGRNAGEGSDRKLENDFNLSDIEGKLIKNVTDAFHAQNKKVVVVLNIGGVIEMATWRNEVDGILLAWQPGLEGGNAMADILSGKVNPSGKLATTFPMSYDDVPSAKNFPGKEFPEQATTGMMGMRSVPAEVIYEEGIYVGYRYYNTFNIPVAYDFGYGLSYTNFNYSNLKLSSSSFNNKITTTITITNSGNKAGKEVVQLYVSAPSKKLNKPVEELKAFAKTNLLKPGQSQIVNFVLNASDLASFYTDKSSWIADEGEYVVKIGASSKDIKQTASFTLRKDIVTEKTNKVLAPKVEIAELKK